MGKRFRSNELIPYADGIHAHQCPFIHPFDLCRLSLNGLLSCRAINSYRPPQVPVLCSHSVAKVAHYIEGVRSCHATARGTVYRHASILSPTLPLSSGFFFVYLPPHPHHMSSAVVSTVFDTLDGEGSDVAFCCGIE